MAERLLVQPSIPQDKLAQALPFQLKTSILIDGTGRQKIAVLID